MNTIQAQAFATYVLSLALPEQPIGKSLNNTFYLKFSPKWTSVEQGSPLFERVAAALEVEKSISKGVSKYGFVLLFAHNGEEKLVSNNFEVHTNGKYVLGLFDNGDENTVVGDINETTWLINKDNQRNNIWSPIKSQPGDVPKLYQPIKI